METRPTTETRGFPPFNKSFFQSFGPSLVTLGLGIGSGEYILWPFLTTQYGYGILWGALIGITLQFFIIQEISRYTAVRGESIVHGFARINKFLPYWLIFSTLIGFGWPGFAATASLLISSLLGLSAGASRILSIALLIATGGMLLFGRNVYKKIELLQKIIVPGSFIVLLFLFIVYVTPSGLADALKGVVGIGNGYFGLPKGLDFAIFLGAFAYAGSGGNFLLGQSFYVIEKEYGNAKHADKLNLHDSARTELLGVPKEYVITEDKQSLLNFKNFRHFQKKEGLLIFWLMGFLTIFMLSYLSKAVLGDTSKLPQNFSFLVLEADKIGLRLGDVFRVAFILIGAFALLSVQLGAFDIMGRFSAWTLRISKHFKAVSLGQAYSIAVLCQMAFGIMFYLAGFSEPLWLVVIGAVINAFSMAVLTIIVLYLNMVHLPPKYRPGILIQWVLVFAVSIYITLFGINVLHVFFK